MKSTSALNSWISWHLYVDLILGHWEGNLPRGQNWWIPSHFHIHSILGHRVENFGVLKIHAYHLILMYIQIWAIGRKIAECAKNWIPCQFDLHSILFTCEANLPRTNKLWIPTDFYKHSILDPQVPPDQCQRLISSFQHSILQTQNQHLSSKIFEQKEKLTAPEGVPRRSPTPVLTGPCAA